MNRWLVLEAFIDNEITAIGRNQQIKMQILNIHASVTGAYVYWGKKGHEHRLFLFDLKARKVYTWAIAFKLMIFENLLLIEKDRRIDSDIQGILIAGGYITPDMKIAQKGRDLIDELIPPPVKTIEIGHIKTSSKLFK